MSAFLYWCLNSKISTQPAWHFPLILVSGWVLVFHQKKMQIQICKFWQWCEASTDWFYPITEPLIFSPTSIELVLCFDHDCDDLITLNLCICHNSFAAMACTNLALILWPRIDLQQKCYVSLIGINVFFEEMGVSVSTIEQYKSDMLIS